jgi:uncharacterized protein YlxW (UPF0749 family)
VKIEGEPDYQRDMESGAIIATNTQALDKYKAERARKLAERQKLESVLSEVESLRKDVAILVSLVNQLSNKQ